MSNPSQSEAMKLRWQDPKLRIEMLAACKRGGEASRGLSRREQIERNIRRQRTLKRLVNQQPIRYETLS